MAFLSCDSCEAGREGGREGEGKKVKSKGNVALCKGQ